MLKLNNKFYYIIKKIINEMNVLTIIYYYFTKKDILDILTSCSVQFNTNSIKYCSEDDSYYKMLYIKSNIYISEETKKYINSLRFIKDKEYINESIDSIIDELNHLLDDYIKG